MDPARMTQLALGFWPARAVSAAAEVGVLDLLDAEGALEAGAIAERLGLRASALVDLLDALVALGVLRREGSRYAAEGRLDPGVLGVADTDAYRAWADLPARLRGDARPSMFERLSPDELAAFASAMGDVSAPAHVAIVERVAEGERVCDVGGGDGRLALVLARAGARATTFDLPALVPVAREVVAGSSVEVVGGDFFVDDLPPSDTAVLCHVLLDWEADAAARLVARVAASASRVLVVDRMTPPDRPTAAVDLLRSLHLLVTVGEAHHHSEAQVRSWLEAAGLAVGAAVEVAGGATLLEGRAG